MDNPSNGLLRPFFVRPGMIEPIAATSPSPRGRITGFVYLLYFLTAIFSEFLVSRKLVVYGDAVNLIATALFILAWCLPKLLPNRLPVQVQLASDLAHAHSVMMQLLYLHKLGIFQAVNPGNFKVTLTVRIERSATPIFSMIAIAQHAMEGGSCFPRSDETAGLRQHRSLGFGWRHG
jgi:hypothetical protein